jgi:hypothetical protein
LTHVKNFDAGIWISEPAVGDDGLDIWHDVELVDNVMA